MNYRSTKNHSLDKWPQVQPPTGLAEQIMAAVYIEPTPSRQIDRAQTVQLNTNMALLTLALAAANLGMVILAPLQLLQLGNLLQHGWHLADWALQSALLMWQGALAHIAPFTSSLLLIVDTIGQPLAQLALQLLTTNVANMPLVVLLLVVSLILVGQVLVLTSLWPSSNQEV